MRLLVCLFICLLVIKPDTGWAWGSKLGSQLVDLESRCAELSVNGKHDYITINGKIKLYDFISMPDECFFEDSVKRSNCKATMYLRAHLINTNIAEPDKIVALSSGALERDDFTALKESMRNGKLVNLCVKKEGIKKGMPQLIIDKPFVIKQLIGELNHE